MGRQGTQFIRAVNLLAVFAACLRLCRPEFPDIQGGDGFDACF
jgi:hypothetical protein